MRNNLQAILRDSVYGLAPSQSVGVMVGTAAGPRWEGCLPREANDQAILPQAPTLIDEELERRSASSRARGVAQNPLPDIRPLIRGGEVDEMAGVGGDDDGGLVYEKSLRGEDDVAIQGVTISGWNSSRASLRPQVGSEAESVAGDV